MFSYVIKEGDTPAGVAVRFTGNPNRLANLLLANPALRRVRVNGVLTFHAADWVHGRKINLPAAWHSVISHMRKARVGVSGWLDGDVPIGGACDSTNWCVEGAECEGGVCVAPVGPAQGGAAAGAAQVFATQAAANVECLNAGGDWDPGLDRCHSLQEINDCTGAGNSWDYDAHQCVAAPPPEPPIVNWQCTEDSTIRVAQGNLGVTVDGIWGCKSQEALDASGWTFSEAAGVCEGIPPNPGLCAQPVAVVPVPPPPVVTPPVVTPPALAQTTKKTPWGWIIAGVAAGTIAIGAVVMSDKKKQRSQSRAA